MSWNDNQEIKPQSNGHYRVMTSFGETLMLEFRNGLWNGFDDADVVAWVDKGPAPVISNIVVEELPPMSAEDFRRLPTGADQDVDTVVSLMKREVGNVTVEFVVYKVTDDANSTVSGRVVAATEHYAAQYAGGNNIVVHERSALSREVNIGEDVTIVYRNGFGDVFSGRVKVADVKIHADGLKSEEIGFMEQMVRSYLGNGLVSADQEDLDQAAEVAYGMAAQEFGLARNPGMLTVRRIDVPLENQARILARAKVWTPPPPAPPRDSSMIKPSQP
jgi:hypothetical protein